MVFFNGRIHREPCRNAHGLHRGSHHVLHPRNADALATILASAASAGHSTFASTDKPEVTPSADIHISLRKFVSVCITRDGSVVAGAAVRMGTLADKLHAA